ncbi:hypothetical protein HUJ04_010040 [Dendroctonus ponderosae]|nr:hypothetical protein HUJ04_010040 [Dendroctonus ponderosae]
MFVPSIEASVVFALTKSRLLGANPRLDWGIDRLKMEFKQHVVVDALGRIKPDDQMRTAADYRDEAILRYCASNIPLIATKLLLEEPLRLNKSACLQDKVELSLIVLKQK